MILKQAVLIRTAKGLRLLSKAILNWPWVVAIICVVSPISLHIRVPYELSHHPCAYLGTRGVIETDYSDCPVIAIIDTRTEERLSW